jgi:hypothetical protein
LVNLFSLLLSHLSSIEEVIVYESNNPLPGCTICVLKDILVLPTFGIVYSRSLSHSSLSLSIGIFTFFEATRGGIIFLNSFSVCSSLVYRKATDFCELILYPATLLKVLMVSRNFFWGGFF